MKRFLFPLLLCLALLTGCGMGSSDLFSSAEETQPVPTVPADGDPDSAACKGSYTGHKGGDIVVAQAEDATLTNRELGVWYWAEVAQYQQSGLEPAPDFTQPLDTQSCPLDSSVATWQQYFLKCALSRWHTAQALILHSQTEPMITEPDYRPDLKKLHGYMDGMPATRVLYGYETHYQPNSLHQAYLDTLDNDPESLGLTAALAEEAFGASEKALMKCVRDLNYAYMYFTDLTGKTESAHLENAAAPSDPRVDIRQILLLKDRSISDCLIRAADLLNQWQSGKNPGADTFAQLASLHSQDSGSAPAGGLYRNLHREQLPQALADWCFEEGRREGDTTVISMDYGVHILYFLGSSDAAALAEAQAREQSLLLEQIRSVCPIQVDYRSIFLKTAAGTVSSSDLLYPDIAHERFPEVPLYLQQSYPDTMYGNYHLSTNGCGITALAMMSSYMADEELTPPEMCALYGSFSHNTGTDGSLFEIAPPQLGYYLVKKSYDWREAREYMEEGHPVIVVQYRGYWTRGGHYLVLETLSEDGLVQVRDSNMYNYAKLRRHKDDLFPWDTINGAGMGYWIFQKKATTTASCTRCGDPDALDVITARDYLCEKCETALLRRNTYLTFS